MAAAKPLWGSERIRSELFKLGIRVAKRTIQKYLRGTPAPRRTGQTGAAFLRNQARGIWACDLPQTADLLSWTRETRVASTGGTSPVTGAR